MTDKQSQNAGELHQVVGQVLEGWTLPPAVRKMLEAAYYSTEPSPAEVELDPTYVWESALNELVDKIIPGLDSGDSLADARTASSELNKLSRPISGAVELTDDQILAAAYASDFGLRMLDGRIECGYRDDADITDHVFRFAREIERRLSLNQRLAVKEGRSIYVEARRCSECDHIGINDGHATDAACHNCDWTGPSPDEDKCPGCGKENCMGVSCPKCSNLYELVADKKFSAPPSTHPLPDDQQAKDAALIEAAKFVINRFMPCRDDYIFSKRVALDKLAAALSAIKQEEVLPWSKEEHDAAVRRMYLQEEV